MADCKILIVDDNEDMIEIVRSAVERDGARILTARNGEAGLKLAREQLPNLIILDVQMPKKDGFATFAELRAEDATRGIPVIMLTAMGKSTGVHFSKAAMGDLLGVEPEAYVEKPVDPAKLSEIVDKVLAR